ARGGDPAPAPARGLGGALLAAGPERGGTQAHALELTAEPRAIASALRRIPLLESLADPALAGLVVVSNTIGPLLAESLPLTLHADPLKAPGRARLAATSRLARRPPPGARAQRHSPEGAVRDRSHAQVP